MQDLLPASVISLKKRWPGLAVWPLARTENRLAALHAGIRNLVAKPCDSAQLTATAATLVRSQ